MAARCPPPLPLPPPPLPPLPPLPTGRHLSLLMPARRPTHCCLHLYSAVENGLGSWGACSRTSQATTAHPMSALFPHQARTRGAYCGSQAASSYWYSIVSGVVAGVLGSSWVAFITGWAGQRPCTGLALSILCCGNAAPTAEHCPYWHGQPCTTQCSCSSLNLPSLIPRSGRIFQEQLQRAGLDRQLADLVELVRSLGHVNWL